MYNQRRSRAPILILIVVGTLLGGGFLVVTNMLNQPGEQATENISAEAVANEAETSSLPEVIEEAPQPNTVDTQQPANVSDLGGEATIFIPSAAIYANIVQVYLDGTSWDVSKLGENIGHLQGTAWLGETGNIVLSGHVELSDGRRGVFANLEEVVVGDFVVLEHSGVEHRYVVTNVYSTAPNDLTPLYPTTTDRLTLITCGNYDFFQDSYLDRIIIVADLVRES